MTKIYVPARPGQRVAQPGNAGDWPEHGQPIDPLSAYHLRLVADGDIILKPKAAKAANVRGGKGDQT